VYNNDDNDDDDNNNNNNNNNKCRHGSVEQMAEKRGFVRRNRGLFNSNTGPSPTNKLQEIYSEAAKHR
jgi:hypothetical protein